MIKNKPIIGIIPTYNIKNEENDPYQDQAKFVSMYFKKVKESGGIPIGLLEENIEEYTEICDGYIWPGGNQILRTFYPIIEHCMKKQKPLLGICLGMQAITTYFNILEDKKKTPEKDIETVYKENKEENPYLTKLEDGNKHLNYVTKEKESIENACHKVNILKDSLLHTIYNCDDLELPSMHSFTVSRVPETLKISGKTDDGIVEAVECTEGKSLILGVQGHPELLEDKRIFEWLIKRCNMK